MTYKSKYLKYKNKCIILKDKLNNIIKKIKLISTHTNTHINTHTNKIFDNDNDYTNKILDDLDIIDASNKDIICDILDKIIDGIDFI